MSISKTILPLTTIFLFFFILNTFADRARVDALMSELVPIGTCDGLALMSVSKGQFLPNTASFEILHRERDNSFLVTFYFFEGKEQVKFYMSIDKSGLKNLKNAVVNAQLNKKYPMRTYMWSMMTQEYIPAGMQTRMGCEVWPDPYNAGCVMFASSLFKAIDIAPIIPSKKLYPQIGGKGEYPQTCSNMIKLIDDAIALHEKTQLLNK